MAVVLRLSGSGSVCKIGHERGPLESGETVPGTEGLPTNEDAFAAERAMERAEDEATIAQAGALLAVAYEQRTLALIEYAKELREAGEEPSRAQRFLDMVPSRLKQYGPRQV